MRVDGFIFVVPIATTRFVTPTCVILSMCVDDTSIHNAATQHLVHMCGRYADPRDQNAAFGTCVWATRRFTKAQINIWYTCVDDASACKHERAYVRCQKQGG